jgi:hypothetical protein
VQDRLDTAVARVREELLATWPVLVDTTDWSWTGDRIDVTGGVLTGAQAKRYVQLLGEALGTDEVPRPAVLSAVDRAWSGYDWVALTGERHVDLFRAPEGEDRQTQWEPPALLRCFARQRSRALAQLPDGTVGWVDAVRLEEARPGSDPWASIVRPGPARAAPPRAPDGLRAAAELARERLGRPYLWGGNTAAAADCSGFVQAVIFGASGVLLPKHTGDQRRRGLRVAASAIEPGDLVFVRGRSRGLGHVGLALAGSDGTTVVHSCLSRRRILEEPLGDFLDRYLFTGARRVVQW